MMRKTLKVTLLLGIFILGQSLSSMASDKVGTTGAAFLKIPCGARAIGMGGAFVALADDASTIYWNPAGLAQLIRREATFTYLHYFVEMGFGYIGYVHPTSTGTFGGAMSYLGHKKIQGYDVDATEISDYSASSMNIALSHGRWIRENFSIGGSIKYINERIENEKAEGYALDLGLLYKIKGFSISLSVQNIGSKMKFIVDEAPLPLNCRLGMAYKMFNNKLTLCIDGNFSNDNDPYFNAGGEYIWRFLAVRVGYRGGPKDEGKSVCGGIGFRWKEFGIDFAYEPYGNLGDTYYSSLLARF